jgi:hypothetical protein
MYLDKGEYAVAQLVEALRKPEGRGFCSRWDHWNFLLTEHLPAALWFWGRLSLSQKRVPGVCRGGKGGFHYAEKSGGLRNMKHLIWAMTHSSWSNSKVITSGFLHLFHCCYMPGSESDYEFHPNYPFMPLLLKFRLFRHDIGKQQ